MARPSCRQNKNRFDDFGGLHASKFREANPASVFCRRPQCNVFHIDL
nr:MAG TPA: hypothetical protein [Caudoviricetes sp.]